MPLALRISSTLFFILSSLNVKLALQSQYNIDAIKFASQGQQRTLVLALKLAELDIIKQKTGFSPILLLDDLFSELDEKNRNNIFKSLDNKIQVFITTTDLKSINKKYLNESYIYEVKNGNIERK